MTTETDLQNFIAAIEAAHFRTDEDRGANTNALFIWNRVREFAGLPELKRVDLPAYCFKHETYHPIREGYGCERKTDKKDAPP
jgi:hypothetical protein